MKNVIEAERFDEKEDRAVGYARAKAMNAAAAAAREAADKGREALDQVLTAVLS